MHSKRRGVALLIVIMVAALVLVAVVGVSAYVSSEQTIVVSDNGFKASLSVAEAGITEAVTNFRRVQWHSSTDIEFPPGAYLTADMVRAMATGAVGTVAVHSDPAFRTFPDATSVFQVKLKKVSGPVWDGMSGWVDQVVRIGVYSLGEKYVNASSAASRDPNGLVGRRVLYSQYDVTYELTPGTAPTMQSPFEYALLSGGMIDLSGNATIIGSSLRSNGVIDVGSHKHSDLFPGDTAPYDYFVETADGINSHGQGGQDSSLWVQPPAQDFVFGNIYMPYYLNMFNDFRSGTGFYNGLGDSAHPTITYPNTTNASLRLLIQRDLGVSGTTATMAQIVTFCDNVLNSKNGYTSAALGASVLKSLQDNLDRATYYVQGPAASTGGTMKGTIAVNGDLTLGGNAGLSAGTGGIALLVHGNLVKGNGTATVIGSVYADGKITQMNGTFDVYGSVATQGAMDKVGGSFTVHFEPTLTDPQIIVGATPTGVTGSITGVIPLTGAQGKWSETDYSAFQNPS